MKSFLTFKEHKQFESLRYSGGDVTKMPPIGELVTRELKSDNGEFVISSATYKFVEVIDDKGKYYITSQWYKSRVPLVIHEDLVEKVTMY